MPWDHNAPNWFDSDCLPLKQEVTSSKHWGPPSIGPLSSTADRPGCDMWHQWLSGSPVLHNRCFLFHLDNIKGTLQYNNQNLITLCNKAISRLPILLADFYFCGRIFCQNMKASLSWPFLVANQSFIVSRNWLILTTAWLQKLIAANKFITSRM